MTNLNIPPFDYKIKKSDEKLLIFDILRKKYVVLTPEEWVRQHFIHYLINHHQYPKSLIKVESGLSYNQRLKRTDIQVFDRDGQLFMIIECKAPHIPLNQQVFEQAAQYNKVLKAAYITITNGLAWYACSTDWETMSIQFLDNLPEFK